MSDVKQCPCRGSNDMCGCQNRSPEGVAHRALPEKIMVWQSNPNLNYTGTWATTRYPDGAVAYAPVDDAMREAVGLARALHRKHYQDDAPQWEPLDTVAGVISQIDNMTAGMGDEITALRARAERAEAALATARRDALEEAAEKAANFTQADHVAQDIKSGVFPCQSPKREAMAAAIRALANEAET